MIVYDDMVCVKDFRYKFLVFCLNNGYLKKKVILDFSLVCIK